MATKRPEKGGKSNGPSVADYLKAQAQAERQRQQEATRGRNAAAASSAQERANERTRAKNKTRAERGAPSVEVSKPKKQGAQQAPLAKKKKDSGPRWLQA